MSFAQTGGGRHPDEAPGHSGPQPARGPARRPVGCHGAQSRWPHTDLDANGAVSPQREAETLEPPHPTEINGERTLHRGGTPRSGTIPIDGKSGARRIR
jgi:hypothetical protein